MLGTAPVGMKGSAVLIVIVALFFAGMGVFGLVAPTALVRPFGIEPRTAEGRAEVRAVYGGFGVAVAGLLLAALALPDLRRGLVLAVAVALLGMAFGRAVSRFVERPGGFYPVWFYFWVELVAAGALLTDLYRTV